MKNFYDFRHKGGATFCAVAHGNILTVQKTDFCGMFRKKNVRVEDGDFVYKLMKTKIISANGASGLLEFLERCSSADDFGGCDVSKVYNYIMDEMREAKV